MNFTQKERQGKKGAIQTIAISSDININLNDASESQFASLWIKNKNI